MAANGLFGAGGNSMIGPPDPKKSFVLSKVEIAVLDKDIYKVVNDLKILIDMAQVMFSVDNNEIFNNLIFYLYFPNRILNLC